MNDMLKRIKRRNKNERPSVERNTSLVQPSELAQTDESSTSASPPPAPAVVESSIPETTRSSLPETTPAPEAIPPSEITSQPNAILSKRGSANAPAPAQSAAAGATAIEAELATLPQVSARRNIRLEVELESRLLTFCQANDITVETFLEACFVEAEQNARTRTEMVAEAKRRLKQRKQAGKLRRVLSQLKK